MSEFKTPKELARELSVSPKTIRQFLRAKYGKLENGDTRWLLDEAQASAVRSQFTA